MKKPKKMARAGGLALALGLTLGSGCATVGHRPEPVAVMAGDLEARWGIEVLGLHPSSAGYMLDFRFRVIDPDKATPLLARGVRPYLIEQRSGARFEVPNPPKVGPLRQTTADGRPLPDRNYFIFFANPGRFVEPGDRVTVVIGDLRLTDLEVQ